MGLEHHENHSGEETQSKEQDGSHEATLSQSPLSQGVDANGPDDVADSPGTAAVTAGMDADGQVERTDELDSEHATEELHVSREAEVSVVEDGDSTCGHPPGLERSTSGLGGWTLGTE